jgi:hypothetical protein
MRSYRKTQTWTVVKSICQLIPTLLQIERTMKILTDKDIQFATASLTEILEEYESGRGNGSREREREQQRERERSRSRARTASSVGTPVSPLSISLAQNQSSKIDRKQIQSMNRNNSSKGNLQSEPSTPLTSATAVAGKEMDTEEEMELIRAVKSALEMLLPACIDYHIKINHANAMPFATMAATSMMAKLKEEQQKTRDAMSRVIKNQLCERLGIIDHLTTISPLQEEAVHHKYERWLEDQAIGQKAFDRLKRKKKLKGFENLSKKEQEKKEKKILKLEKKQGKKICRLKIVCGKCVRDWGFSRSTTGSLPSSSPSAKQDGIGSTRLSVIKENEEDGSENEQENEDDGEVGLEV